MRMVLPAPGLSAVMRNRGDVAHSRMIDVPAQYRTAAHRTASLHTTYLQKNLSTESRIENSAASAAAGVSQPADAAIGPACLPFPVGGCACAPVNSIAVRGKPMQAQDRSVRRRE